MSHTMTRCRNSTWNVFDFLFSFFVFVFRESKRKTKTENVFHFHFFVFLKWKTQMENILRYSVFVYHFDFPFVKTKRKKQNTSSDFCFHFPFSLIHIRKKWKKRTKTGKRFAVKLKSETENVIYRSFLFFFSFYFPVFTKWKMQNGRYFLFSWVLVLHFSFPWKMEKLVPWGTDGRLPLSDLDLDLRSGHTAYRRASLIDLYLRTEFHWGRKRKFFEGHNWGFGQVQSHVT